MHDGPRLWQECGGCSVIATIGASSAAYRQAASDSELDFPGWIAYRWAWM